MTHPAILTLGAACAPVLALSLLMAPCAAQASPLDLAGGCAVSSSASLHEGGGLRGGGFEASRVEVVVPGLLVSPAPSLRAGHVRASAEGGMLPPAQLEQAATAAAAGLLTALSGHRDGGCPDQVLQDAAAPLAQALQHGGRIEFTWSDVSVHAGAARFGARSLSLRLDGTGGGARLTAVLNGAISNDPAAALLPEALAIRATLPASELPALFAATSGHGAPVDVTIEQADARRGDTTLSGHGVARLASTPEASSGNGHVTVHGFDALIDAAAGLDRIRTALFLAKLVAHRQGDQTDWDLAWQGGTLMVNNVPLPLR